MSSTGWHKQATHTHTPCVCIRSHTGNSLHIAHTYKIIYTHLYIYMYIYICIYLYIQILILGYTQAKHLHVYMWQGLLGIYICVYLYLYMNTIQSNASMHRTSQWPWRWLIAEGEEGWIEVAGMTSNILIFTHWTLDTENLFMVGTAIRFN